ncbi:MAG: PAS domain-containing protein [Burkholderiales bacterium]
MNVGLVITLIVSVAGLALAALLPEHTVLVLAWFLALLVLSWVVLDRWAHRPLKRMTRYAQALAQREAPEQLPQASGDWSVIAQSVSAVAETREKVERAVVAERAARQDVEERLKEIEERYTIAVRGASDGLWDLTVRSGAMHLAPRWKAMLGFRDQEVPDSLEGWKSRLHPADREAVVAALSAHIDNATEKFESEHRMVHRDGTIRWVLSRGVALRHGDDSSHRVVGMDTDITPFKRLEAVMMHVAEGTSGSTGEAFFRSLVQHFAMSLNVRVAFVTECMDDPATRVRALACWKDGSFVSGLEYDLDGTPCKEVFAKGLTVLHPRDVEARFPIERGKDFESYLGVPIVDVAGRVIGHLAFFDNKEMDVGLLPRSIYRIFAARAAAEMMRARTERAVLELANRLYGVRGDACLQMLVEEFARQLGVREAFVCECIDEPATRVRMLAHWNKGQHTYKVEFDLSGTACEHVIHDGRMLFIAEGVGERWPREATLDRDSYLGVPCFDAEGKIIGHIACMNGGPMRPELPDQAILKLFSERAALELERCRLLARMAA